jgi:GNAT superfamily N-acetyltransferase
MPSLPSHELNLRIATEADALCIGVLAMQVFLETYATEGIRPSIAREVLEQLSTPAVTAMLAAPGARFILAEQAGHLVAFAQVQVGAKHELVQAVRPAEIVRLYMQERFAGRGLGKKLLSRAESLAASENATHTWLTAWVGNVRALAFYTRCGYFERGSTTYSFQGEHHENRLFVKELANRDAP